jgi:hypothetical protein
MAIRAGVETGRGRWFRHCGMLALHASLWIWLLVIILIVWLPASEFGGLDLTSTVVQDGSFAAGAVLLALMERSRPRLWRRPSPGQSRFQDLIARFARPLGRLAALLAFYAAILELGQYGVDGRRFRLAPLVPDTPRILLGCAALYAIVRFALAAARRGREAERHLERVAAAFRCEAKYAALLRDAIQAAYAVCLAPSPPAENRIERVRQLLDEALGAELPNPDEDVLDIMFGPRKAAPAENRPKIEAAAARPSR